MPDTAYTFALDQYVRQIAFGADPAEAYRHSVGDIVQLQVSRPSVEIVSRHCGGFGAVYVVRSLADGQFSAVKGPRLDRHSSPDQLDAFAHEATLWRNLPSHPFVLPALRVFRYDQRPYIEMPYVEPISTSGSSLASILTDGPHLTGLSTGFSTLVIGQLLNVLAFLERSVPGFGHGDIKPANILLHAPGEAAEKMAIQLSDFGLARALGHIGSPSSSIAGDRYYLPSEWLRPGALAVSPAGQPVSTMQDIYAFGCTAMELLLNLRWQAPDQNGQWRTLADHGLTFDHLADTRPDIGSAALRVLWRCVGVPTGQRWFTFQALAEAWDEVMAARTGVTTHAVSSWRPLGAELEEDSGPESNEVYQYLVHIGTPAEEAARVCLTLWDASQHRAVGQIEQSSTLLAGIRAAYPALVAAITDEAHGLSLIEDRIDEATSLYREAIGLYQADDEQRTFNSLGYAAACGTLAQMLLAGDDRDADPYALTMAREAVAAEPSIGRLHLTLGHALLALGDFDSSVHALQEAARLDPGHSFVKPFLITARGLASGAFFDPVGLEELEPEQRDFARRVWARWSPAFRRLGILTQAGRHQEAAAFLTDVAEQCRERGDQGGQAQVLANLAIVLRRLGQLPEAAATHRQAAAVFAAIGRPNSSGDQVNYAGLVWHSMGQFDEAASAHHEAAAVFVRTGDRHRLVRAWVGRASALSELRRWDDAVAECERAIRLSADLIDPAGEADAWAQLGEAQDAAGKQAEAVTAFQEALARYRNTGNIAGQGLMLDNIGVALSGLGRSEEAIAAHREAVTILSEPGHEVSRLRAQGHVVADLFKHGLFDDAIAIAEAELAADGTLASNPAAARLLNNAGSALVGKHRFTEAIVMHRQAAELYQSVGKKPGQALALNNLGAALSSAQQPDDAMAAFAAAARLSAEIGDSQREAEALLNIGLVLSQAQNLPAAISALRHAVGKSAACGDRKLQGKALANLAGALAETGQFDEAIDAYQEAAIAYGDSGDRTNRGRAFHNLGMAQYQLGRYDLAAAALLEDRAICHEEQDFLGEAQTTRNLATVMQAASRLDEAEENLRSAAALYARAGEHFEQGAMLHDLGEMLIAQSRAAEAVAILREAASALASSSGNWRRCVVLVDLGILLAHGSLEEALSAVREALSLSEGLGQPHLVGYAQLGLGTVLAAGARLAEAEQALLSAQAKFIEAQQPELIEVAEKTLVEIRRAEGTSAPAS